MSDTVEAPTPAQAPAAEDDFIALATQHEQAGRLEEAQACIDRALEKTPDDGRAVHMAGVLAFRAGRRDEAVRLMERSLTLGPAKPYYLRNLCEIYRLLGRYDEALKVGDAAVKGDPRDPIALLNLAVLHYARREPERSIDAAHKALVIDPQMPGGHFALAEAWLLQGNFGPGWEEYEWRFRLKGVPKLMPKDEPPLWDGKAMPKGRLMLIADQGFGDCIQFGRYIPWAAQRCGELVIACSREMAPVISQLAPGAVLFDRWEDCPESVAHCPLSGLPRLHGTDLATIPSEIAYLHADPKAVAAWAERLNQLAPPSGRRIGVVWAGRPTHNNDANRSIALKALAPICDLDGVTLVSLQKGPPQTQVGDYFGRAPLINLGPEIATFADTMAIIDSLDLVVSVDTSVAHLAAALGKPTWIMLPHACDWRWLLERTDSPWYPTVRLFRQPGHHRWTEVISTVADAIAGKEGPYPSQDLSRRIGATPSSAPAALPATGSQKRSRLLSSSSTSALGKPLPLVGKGTSGTR